VTSLSVTCEVPAFFYRNETAQAYVSLVYEGILLRRFDFQFYLPLELVSIYPRRGPYLGGTILFLQAVNLPLQSIQPSLSCRFSYDLEGSSYTLAATRLNDTFVSCLTPDISTEFTPGTDSYKDILVGLTELDGTYSLKQKLKFTYQNKETLVSITPVNSFIDQKPYITVTGTNFLNVASLCVKAVFQSNQHELIFN